MKISTTLIAAFGLAALAACDNRADDNAAINVDANLDANLAVDNMGMTDPNMDANGTINAADGMNSTENAMANDLTSNDADTNLANGM